MCQILWHSSSSKGPLSLIPAFHHFVRPVENWCGLGLTDIKSRHRFTSTWANFPFSEDEWLLFKRIIRKIEIAYSESSAGGKNTNIKIKNFLLTKYKTFPVTFDELMVCPWGDFTVPSTTLNHLSFPVYWALVWHHFVSFPLLHKYMKTQAIKKGRQSFNF